MTKRRRRVGKIEDVQIDIDALFEKKKRFKKFREGTIKLALTTETVEDSVSEEDEEIQVISIAVHSERTGGTIFLHIDWLTSSGGLRSR